MPLGVLGWVAVGTAVANIGAGLYESNKAGKIGSSANARAGIEFSEQQDFEKQLAALINDPSSVSSLPGYQFQMDQGTQAVARQMAGSGFLKSGNEATALTEFGQGLASSFYGQQTNLLASLSGLAPSSPTQQSGVALAAQGQGFDQMSQILASMGYGMKYALGSSQYGQQQVNSFYNTNPQVNQAINAPIPQV